MQERAQYLKMHRHSSKSKEMGILKGHQKISDGQKANKYIV